MRRNGLYMIVLSRDGTEIQGERKKRVRVCVFVVCVWLNNLITHVDPHLEIMSHYQLIPFYFTEHFLDDSQLKRTCCRI